MRVSGGSGRGVRQWGEYVSCRAWWGLGRLGLIYPESVSWLVWLERGIVLLVPCSVRMAKLPRVHEVLSGKGVVFFQEVNDTDVVLECNLVRLGERAQWRHICGCGG